MMSKAGYRVLFVQPSSHNLKAEGLQQVRPDIWTITPRGLPYERVLPFINSFNGKQAFSAIKTAADRLNFKNPVLWFDRVHGVSLKNAFDFYTVYDLIDEILAFGRKRNDRMLINIENTVLCNCDLLLSSSMTLMERKIEQSGRKGESIFLPNGVETNRFRDDRTDDRISMLPRPVLGFVGTISERSIDFALVHEVASGHPEWTFVFVGPGGSKNRFSGQNIKFFDAVSGDGIPAVINSFDVGLIPYNLKKQDMDYVFPRKACEYLAAGKPVVSTPLSEVALLKEYVKTGSNPDEFEPAIEAALAEGEQLRQERMNYAQKYDWQVLMGSLLSRLDASSE